MIAAINGIAIGAGLTLTFLADIRIVAEDARLRLPFVRLNVIPDANSTWLLPRLVGLSRGLELLLTGRWFTGQEAADMGLASRAVPAAEVLGVAQELAREIAANTGPVAVGVTKQLVYKNLMETDRVAAFTEETKLTWWAGSQPDTIEGVTALMAQAHAAMDPVEAPADPGRPSGDVKRTDAALAAPPVGAVRARARARPRRGQLHRRDGVELHPGRALAAAGRVPLRRHRRGRDPGRDGDRRAARHACRPATSPTARTDTTCWRIVVASWSVFTLASGARHHLR